ncbi:MAG: MazG nucleotide pyrophosphohydrolase domain-containing protein [Acidimicrobiales bacterium]
MGLGPAGPELLTIATRTVLATADSAFLRTRRHPATVGLGGVESFDHHYDASNTFDEVYGRIVEDIVAAAYQSAAGGRGGHVVYGVPGSPLVAERTVEMLRADRRVDVSVIPALSFLDLAWDRLGLDPVSSGVRMVDGMRFAEAAAGERGPLLVAQCWSTSVLSEIKLSVDTDRAGSPPVVTVLHHLGLPDEWVGTVPWNDVDRAVVPDHLTSIFIPSVGTPIGGELVALDGLVRRLRHECPWDRRQTHASLTRNLLEEAYEVVDAIDGLGGAGPGELTAGSQAVDGDPFEHLAEELGDLLFQVYFHAYLAAEAGRFTLADVARGIHDKLVARHPHVFGDAVVTDPAAVEAHWEDIKRAEKGRGSVTDGIPNALPALALSAKLQRTAGGVAGIELPGFEQERAWVAAALAQLPAPTGGVVEPVRPGDDQDDGSVLRQVGALLWSVADLGRLLGVDPEDALRVTARRFRQHVLVAEGRAGRPTDA